MPLRTVADICIYCVSDRHLSPVLHLCFAGPCYNRKASLKPHTAQPQQLILVQPRVAKDCACPVLCLIAVFARSQSVQPPTQPTVNQERLCLFGWLMASGAHERLPSMLTVGFTRAPLRLASDGQAIVLANYSDLSLLTACQPSVVTFFC